MDAIWNNEFEDFGEDRYLPYERSPLASITPPASLLRVASSQKRIAYLKRGVAETAPRLPGVYGMVDATGRLVYVGKSKLLRNRLLSYFMPNNERDKAGRISNAAFRIVWEEQPSEFAALLREQQLIRHWLPRYNVVGIPRRRSQAFLCLGKGPAESFYLSRYNDPAAMCSIGPLSGVGQLNRAVEILARHYGLRDCSQKTKIQFSEQLTLFDLDPRAGCVRYELGNCLGPCLPGSRRDEYAEKVQQALGFMKTGSTDLLEALELTMRRAASNLQFETAAKIREDIRTIEWLARRLGAFQKARDRKATLYSVPGVDRRPIWYLLRFGGVADVLAAPQNAAQWKKNIAKLKRWGSGENDTAYTLMRPEETLGLVTSWLQIRTKSRANPPISPPHLDSAPHLGALPHSVAPAHSASPPRSTAPECWTAPMHEMPTEWAEVKRWIKNKSLPQSLV